MAATTLQVDVFQTNQAGSEFYQRLRNEIASLTEATVSKSNGIVLNHSLFWAWFRGNYMELRLRDEIRQQMYDVLSDGIEQLVPEAS